MMSFLSHKELLLLGYWFKDQSYNFQRIIKQNERSIFVFLLKKAMFLEYCLVYLT